MQVLRDRETQTAGLLDKYSRAEVVVDGNSACDRNFAKGPMFQEVHASSGAKDSVDLRSVLKRQDWVTYSAQSVKHIYSEMELLAYLNEHSLWEYSCSAWQVLLLLEGGIICDRSGQDERYGLVVRVLEGAALIRPASRVASDMIELDIKGRLEWKVVLVAGSFDVLPVECLSPLGAIAAGWCATRSAHCFAPWAPPRHCCSTRAGLGGRGCPRVRFARS